jgi:hypothetical protein
MWRVNNITLQGLALTRMDCDTPGSTHPVARGIAPSMTSTFHYLYTLGRDRVWTGGTL